MGEEERQILGGTQAWGNGFAGVAGGGSSGWQSGPEAAPPSAPQPALGGPTKPWLGMPPAHHALPAAMPRILRPLCAPAWKASSGPVQTPQKPPALVSPPPHPGMESGGSGARRG